jgi:hypothetical protein
MAWQIEFGEAAKKDLSKLGKTGSGSSIATAVMQSDRYTTVNLGG